ncbi:MAG: tRNA pseudouridine(55) synthase TruB, partial [Clostridia bacterium]|nr:tRNA pseudouridine(55) synthase TruB [Clostridia bacterium]
DPMATGVLPILLGRATRLCELMLTADKRYTAEVLIGVETDTLDITGNVISETDCDISVVEFESVCSRFVGEYEQVPPMFSALKKDGVRLYDLARQGVEIEREARLVNIKKLDIIEKSGKNKFIIDVICSKGTYIRSLADDLGKALGVGATLTMRRRIETAGYTADMCVTLDELKENPQKYLREADSVVAYCPSVNVTDNQTRRFLNGGELFLERINFDTEVSDGDLIRVYSYDNKFLGLGLVDGELLKIKCIITE